MHASIAEAQQAAKDAALAAIVERYPATVVIDDETPEAGAQMGPEGYAFDQAGHAELTQQGSVAFLKTEFTGTPVRGRSLTIDGRGFRIDSVAGHLEADRHWLLRCSRTPGADEDE
jgi:hypothetical protein